MGEEEGEKEEEGDDVEVEDNVLTFGWVHDIGRH